SKGMAGVPRASLVVIAATLASFNIPEAGLLLIIGIDQFLDMGRSAANVIGKTPGTPPGAKWGGGKENPRAATVGIDTAAGGCGAVFGFATGRAWEILFVIPAIGQESTNVGVLSGTLKKVKDTGTITLGYRESSLPFSYLNKRQQPIGYSIDLCREIVEEVST